MDSFEGELGVVFPVKVEASHVVDLKSQVFVAAVSTCGGIQLNSAYANSASTEYQDSLGLAVLKIATISRGGTLVFLSSYACLDKVFLVPADHSAKPIKYNPKLPQLNSEIVTRKKKLTRNCHNLTREL